MSNTQHRVTGPAQITGVSTGVGQHRVASPAQFTVGASSGTAPRPAPVAERSPSSYRQPRLIPLIKAEGP